MIDILRALFSTSGFMPHGSCYLWKPGLVFLHVLSDGVIALSYFSIPLMLVYFVSRRRENPFNWVLLLFGTFIVACGTGHLMDIWTLWHPTYWLSGLVRALTAFVSFCTAVQLAPVIPQVLALPNPEQLEATNRDLEQALRQLQATQAQLIATEIKLTKAETLRQSEERFRSLLQNSSNIIATLKPGGQIDYISPSLTPILGYRPEGWIAKSLPELVHPDDHAAAANLVSQTFEAPSFDATAEFRLQRVDNSWRDFEAIAKNLLNEPNVSGIVITCRDITERKQAEADIRQALDKERELNELKSRFISMASHEFRTPLSVISSSIGILEHYGFRLNEDQKQKQLQHVQRSIRHVTQLLDDMLMINRAEAKKLEFDPASLDITQFCKDLVEEIQLSAPHRTINLSSDELEHLDQGWLMLDRKLLWRILENLLSNAIKYSSEGCDVDFNVLRREHTVVFQIQDYGIGIPQEDQDRLFESFHRANNVGNIPGTGLGLAIVKKCVDLHSGKILVESRLGVGTTFTITIPLKMPSNQTISAYQEAV